MRYCNIHGYQYRRYVVQAAQKDRFYGWHKPALWAKLLTEFSVVVAIDFDVIFQDLTLSLESMLSRWGFTAHTLVMQPYDPEQDFNYVTKPDGERVLSVNIGFSVLRSSRKVIDLLHQWSRCTIDIKACKQYKGLHLDQDTWSMYFKPKLTDLEFVAGEACSCIKECKYTGSFHSVQLTFCLLAAPCNEANGHTQSEGLEHFNDGCNGTLVAHHWTAPPGVLPHLRQLVWKAYVTDVPRRVIPITL